MCNSASIYDHKRKLNLGSLAQQGINPSTYSEFQVVGEQMDECLDGEAREEAKLVWPREVQQVGGLRGLMNGG